LSADRGGRLNMQGTPHQLLAHYVIHMNVIDMNVDLVVVGPVGRGALRQLLVGSVARAIHAAVMRDVRIAREPRATPSASPA
jgi:nucleotide-binding universal stress UspA family protein